MISITVFLIFLLGNSIAMDMDDIIEYMGGAGREELVINGIELTNENMKSIGAALNGTGITSLSFKDNAINFNMTILANALIDSNITTLKFERNNVSQGLGEIANVLSRTKITHLDIPWNRITKEGIEPIMRELKNTSIISLELRGNQLGDEGVKIIAKGLIDTGVIVLDVGNNSITEIGARALAEVLNRTQIVGLYLGDNRIGDVGLKAITEVLDQTLIIFLNVPNNGITDGGAKELIPILIDNRMIALGVSGNRLNRSLEEQISSLVESKRRGVGNLGKRINHLVANRNGFLEFDIKGAYNNKTQYKEIVEIVGKKKRSFVIVLSQIVGVNYTRNQIVDFFENIENRLSECFRKTDLLYETFKKFIIDKNPNLDSIDNKFPDVFSDERYVDYLLSRGNGTYTRYQIYRFMEKVEDRLMELNRKNVTIVQKNDTIVQKNVAHGLPRPGLLLCFSFTFFIHVIVRRGYV